MPEQRITKRNFFHALRNVLITMAVLCVLLVAVSGIAVAAVWGHFWDFRVGDPQSESCVNCHVMQTYVNSVENGEMLASFHASRDVGCTGCHARTFENQFSETVSYLRSDYQEPLTQAHYSMEDMCFQCHEHGSYDQIAWRTTDLGVTDAQASGHSANPHQPPHFTNLECDNCHLVHQPETLLCAECHTYEFNNP